MKKTYVESWFVNCQPGSIMMNKLTKPIATLGDAAVVILQSEVIANNYVLFEVMNKEDYLKYADGTVDMMKNKIVELEKKLFDIESNFDFEKKCLEDQLVLKDTEIQKEREKFYKCNFGELICYVDSSDRILKYTLDGKPIDYELGGKIYSVYEMLNMQYLINYMDAILSGTNSSNMCVITKE